MPKGYEIITVPPGTVVCGPRSRTTSRTTSPSTSATSLRDNPELQREGHQEPGAELDPTTNEPIVTFEFTDKGRKAFHDVTQRLAERGQTKQIPGQPVESSFQTFAVVLDREVVTRPFIDFSENPDGIDGRTGAQISGGFTLAGRPGPRRVPEDRRAADQPEADQPDAGLRHARQAGAATRA